MWLIVGLGNPGEEYESTRHNLGFQLVDRMAQTFSAKLKRKECSSLTGRAVIDGNPAELAKPQTFMNASGQAVKCLIKKLELSASSSHLVVISDDLALPFGKIRFRRRGSAGGHNGLKSVIEEIGSDEFVRLRIGIGPEHPVSDARNFVLGRFTSDERKSLDEILDRSQEAVLALISQGLDQAMAQFN